MPILILLALGFGGAGLYWKSRNMDGQVPSPTPGIVYLWAVDGGWSGGFSASWKAPTGNVVQLGEFESMETAKASALAAIVKFRGVTLTARSVLPVGVQAMSVKEID